MIERGVVLDVQKDFAKVRVGRNSACGSCGKCGMTENQKHVDFLASNEAGASVGDTVALDIPETNSAKLALVGYFIPLIPALAFLFVAIGIHLPDWAAAVMFAGGLAVGFAVVALIDKLRRHKWMETPRIVEIVGTSNGSRQTDVNGADTGTEQLPDGIDQEISDNKNENNEKGDNNE